MRTIKAIIVDDEHRARRVLKNLLENLNINIQIVSECNGVEDAIQKIKEHSPDVVFLDVQMPNYAGYELVNFFEEINFEIIFVTAYNHYAIKAFELCAIDYLVKPIDRNRLKESLCKLHDRLVDKNKLVQYQTLLNSIKSKDYQKIIIPELGNRRILELSDIIAIEASGAYTEIYLHNKNKITTSKNLKYYENLLPDNTNFLRVHRSWIVNLNYSNSMNRTEGTITMNQGIIAKLSRTNYEKFSKALNKL